MKNKNLIFKLLCAVIVTVSAVTACYDDMAEVPTVKLGSIESEYIISVARTLFDIEIYANGPYHIEIEGEPDWLTLTPGEIVDGMTTITAECLANSRFKRAAQFVLCSDVDTRRDTVTIKQEGLIEAYIEFDDASVIISQDAGVTIDSLKTNVLFEEMTIQVNYVDEEGWVTDLEIVNSDSDDCTLRITATANTNEEDPRIATATISFTDGWGDRVEVDFNVVQLNAKGEIGSTISFEEFRDNYADLGSVIDYVLLEGYVVSNPEFHNAGENEQVTASTVDRTASYTTVYMESLDGNSGLKFTTSTIDDNIFNQFDHVILLMKGTYPYLKTSPTRLDVEGVTKAMIVSRIAGTKDDIPVKNKGINDLTDDDVYTYVRLNDVELPVRKGSLMPVDENYTVAGKSFSMSNITSGSGQCPKYGVLVRGKDGGSLYMWTNENCDYRQNARRLPQGSGVISGVIVHERFARYTFANGADPTEMEIDESLGNVGRYQIRHQTEGDIWDEMNMDFKDSFSELLCEYRIWSYTTDHIRSTYCKETITDDYQAYLDNENGWLTHTYQTAYTGDSNKNYAGSYSTHLTSVVTMDYLGPKGTSDSYYFGANYGNRNGCGMVVDPDHDYMPRTTDAPYERISFNPDGTIEYLGPYATAAAVGNSSAGTGWVSNDDCANNESQINYISSANRGKGFCGTGCYTAWGSSYWWDYDNDRFYSFLIKFSTLDISTDQISLQISARNRYETYGPKYWRAEWAFTDSQDPADDDQWHLIADYTVPDQTSSSGAATWYDLPGFKPMNFALPLEILGQDVVYIRLHPTSDLCSDGDGYANTHLSEYGTTQQRVSALNYVAIRYNK